MRKREDGAKEAEADGRPFFRISISSMLSQPNWNSSMATLLTQSQMNSSGSDDFESKDEGNFNESQHVDSTDLPADTLLEAYLSSHSMGVPNDFSAMLGATNMSTISQQQNSFSPTVNARLGSVDEMGRDNVSMQPESPRQTDVEQSQSTLLQRLYSQQLQLQQQFQMMQQQQVSGQQRQPQPVAQQNANPMELGLLQPGHATLSPNSWFGKQRWSQGVGASGGSSSSPTATKVARQTVDRSSESFPIQATAYMATGATQMPGYFANTEGMSRNRPARMPNMEHASPYPPNNQEATTHSQVISAKHNEENRIDTSQPSMLGAWSAASAELLGDLALASQAKAGRSRKKPKNQPKRPLSAYNIFFKEERQRILDRIPDTPGIPDDSSTAKAKKKPHGKIGFQNLARAVAKQWQSLPREEVARYQQAANADAIRYKREMQEFMRNSKAAETKLSDDES